MMESLKNIPDRKQLEVNLLTAVYREKGWYELPKDLQLLIVTHINEVARDSKHPKRDLLNPLFYHRVKNDLKKILKEYRTSHG